MNTYDYEHCLVLFTFGYSEKVLIANINRHFIHLLKELSVQKRGVLISYGRKIFEMLNLALIVT